MGKLVTVAAIVLLGIFSGQIKAKPADSQDKIDTWWKPILHLIQDPCKPNDVASQSKTIQGLFPDDKSEKDTRHNCLPLDHKSLKATAEEGEELAEEVLKNKTFRRFVKFRFSSLARKLRCDLKLSVPVRKRRGLTMAQGKALEDLIQLGSFTHYLDQVKAAFIGRRYAPIRDGMAKLSKKLKVISCKLRPALTNSTLDDYVIPADVPIDLRHKKRGPKGRVATYVILEKVQTFIRDLPDTYKTKAFKLCEN